MKFKITQNENTVAVKVTLPKRLLASEERISCDLGTVKEYLKAEKIQHGEVTQSEFLVLRNTSDNNVLTGTWKFAKIKQKTRKVRTGNESNTPKQTRTRTRKPKAQD